MTRYAQRLQHRNLRKATLKTTAAKVDYVAQEKVGLHCLACFSCTSSLPAHWLCLHGGPSAAMKLRACLINSVCMLQGDKNTLEYRIFFEQNGEEQKHDLRPASAPCSHPLPLPGAYCASSSCRLCCRQPKFEPDRPRICIVWTCTALVMLTLPARSLCPQATGYWPDPGALKPQASA